MALSSCGVTVNSQGRELTEHGTAMFPAACCHDDLSVAAVPWHWHEELEAVVVTEGAAKVAVDGEQAVIRQGEGFFVNSGALHAARTEGPSGCRFHSLVFHPRLVGAGIDSVFWLRYVQPLTDNRALRLCRFDGSAPWHSAANAAVEAAWQSLADEPAGYEFQVREALSRLVFLLTEAYRPTDAHPTQRMLRDDRRIKEMLRFIQERYADNLSAGEIARAASISESECLRCFRHTIGASPVQYLNQYRVQKAAELLTATDLRAADVGSLCGFQDASYFTKVFRGSKGCTPTEYREQAARRA